ncbi:MAG: hypothetical protein M3R72_09500 [Bacteroidota bacterium]|nr:hypothetical protein [Bacteroidota bacterium]
MTVLAILLLIVVLVLLLNFKSKNKDQLLRLEQEMKELKKLLSQQLVEQAKPLVEEVKSEVPTPQKKEDYWETSFEVVKETPPSFKKEEWLPKEAVPHETAAFSRAGNK